MYDEQGSGETYVPLNRPPLPYAAKELKPFLRLCIYHSEHSCEEEYFMILSNGPQPDINLYMYNELVIPGILPAHISIRYTEMRSLGVFGWI